MKYVALLRAINVGGSGIIKMAELKKALEESGFTQVSTYIQSGNVIFKSDHRDIEKIIARFEAVLFKKFRFSSGIIVKTYGQLKTIISEIPADWKMRDDLRCYVAFIREPISTEDVLREVRLKEGADFVNGGDGVLYMATLLSGFTKSGFARLVGTRISKDITIRSYHTVQKLLELMH